MNETKVNTKLSDVTSAEAKKIVFAGHHVGIISTPYGIQLINRNEAIDHASMRAKQLGALLRLMQTESSGAGRFCQLGPGHQDHLLWLGVQLADELHAMVDVVVADQQEAQA